MEERANAWAGRARAHGAARAASTGGDRREMVDAATTAAATPTAAAVGVADGGKIVGDGSSDDRASSEGRTGGRAGVPRGHAAEKNSSLNVFEMDDRPTGVVKPNMRAWQSWMLIGAELALATGIFALYTMIGFGAKVYRSLANDDNWRLAWGVAGGSVVLMSVLWILDAVEATKTRGTTTGKIFAFSFAVIALAGLIVSGMLSVKEYETLPLSLYMLFKAGIVQLFKSTACRGTHTASFLREVARASYVVSFTAFSAFVVWSFVWDKRWSNEMFNAYAIKMGCGDTSATAGNDLIDGCENVVYIIYAAPLAISALNLVYGLSCSRLAKGAGALQLVTILAIIVGFGSWISVALSPVEMGIATDAIQLAVVFCAMFAIACFITAGPKRLAQQVTKNKLAQKVIGYTKTDLAKALLFCATMTLIPFALAVSAVSAFARRLGFSLHKKDPDAPKDGFITAESREMLAWWFAQPTKIFKYSAYISLFYFVFSIGVGKMAVLFLAWLVDVLGSLNEITVIFVFILIGVCMFLLPPVPGPPVYLTGGILIVGRLESKIGFWPATLLCCGICWFTKLLSCALQQKMIGEQLGKYPSIRYTVGINSLQMRAIRYCLEQKGFSREKIAILCGGPDWPTSVLCGILKLSVIQMSIGTSPVLILYLGYTTVAGALQLKVGSCGDSTGASSSSTWGLLNSLFLALAFVSMLSTSMAAVYYMEQTIMNKREILDEMPVDEEVEELDRLDRVKEETYATASKWENLSGRNKFFIVSAAVSGILSCQLGVVLAQRSFRTFSVSCPIALTDVVLPTGWLSIGLIVACYVFTSLFRSSVGRLVQAELTRSQGIVSEETKRVDNA